MYKDLTNELIMLHERQEILHISARNATADRYESQQKNVDFIYLKNKRENNTAIITETIAYCIHMHGIPVGLELPGKSFLNDFTSEE